MEGKEPTIQPPGLGIDVTWEPCTESPVSTPLVYEKLAHVRIKRTLDILPYPLVLILDTLAA
jgi:hypothetical protein